MASPTSKSSTRVYDNVEIIRHYYMAPELSKGKHRQSVDIWSLVYLICYLVTGVEAFYPNPNLYPYPSTGPTPTAQEVINRWLNGDFRKTPLYPFSSYLYDIARMGFNPDGDKRAQAFGHVEGNISAMRAVRNHPWFKQCERFVYKNVGMGVGYTGSACRIVQFRLRSAGEARDGLRASRTLPRMAGKGNGCCSAPLVGACLRRDLISEPIIWVRRIPSS